MLLTYYFYTCYLLIIYSLLALLYRFTSRSSLRAPTSRWVICTSPKVFVCVCVGGVCMCKSLGSYSSNPLFVCLSLFSVLCSLSLSVCLSVCLSICVWESDTGDGEVSFCGAIEMSGFLVLKVELLLLTFTTYLFTCFTCTLAMGPTRCMYVLDVYMYDDSLSHGP